jgi:hypothetical protein
MLYSKRYNVVTFRNKYHFILKKVVCEKLKLYALQKSLLEETNALRYIYVTFRSNLAQLWYTGVTYPFDLAIT